MLLDGSFLSPCDFRSITPSHGSAWLTSIPLFRCFPGRREARLGVGEFRALQASPAVVTCWLPRIFCVQDSVPDPEPDAGGIAAASDEEGEG